MPGLGFYEAIIILMFIITFAFQLAMAFDLLFRKQSRWLVKLLWFLIIFVAPPIGAAAYYFMAHSRRAKIAKA